MKKREQKGFTIVELVIVIAVIAVLATVLVPTFGDLIGRAQAAAATQQVANAYKEALVKALADDGIITEDEKVTVGQFIFTFKEGGQGAQIRAEDFLYPQVCIVDGKVQLGPKNEAGETTEATKEQEHQPDVQPEPTIMVESITLEQSALALSVGGKETLTRVILPAAAADRKVAWSSDNESVATVTEDGMVIAVGVGKATITASVDEKSATCSVYVANAIASVSDKTSLGNELNQGASVLLTKGISCSKKDFTIGKPTGVEKATVIFDLNNCELQSAGMITVGTGVELIIMNGKLSTTSYIKVDNGGKLTIINCELSSSGYYVVYDAGAVAITDSTIKYESGSCAIYVGYSTGEASLDLVRTNITAAEAAIQVSDNDIVNITGGTITSTTTSKGIYAIDVLNGQGTVNFYKDGNNFVTITAKNAYTQNSNDGATSCFVGKDNVKIQAPA